MGDLICEIIEAFEAARVEFNEAGDGGFLRCLYMHRCIKEANSQKTFAKHLVPILEKHVKPDRIEEIDSLLEKLQNEYPDAHTRLSGKGKGSIWNGTDSFLLPFGPSYQFSTPEAALLSLLPDESVAPSPSEQLAAGSPVEGIVEIDGQRFKVTLTRNED